MGYEIGSYGMLESFAFKQASDAITSKNKKPTDIYHQIIGRLREEFPWIPYPTEGRFETEEEKQTFVQANQVIKDAIRDAIEDFEKMQLDAPTLMSNEEAHFDDSSLSPLDAIRAWSMENTHLPPVRMMTFFSRVKASDEREFYNAIQRLREKGWSIESLGRGKGYQLIAPAGVSEELQDLLAKAQLLDPERIKELKAQIEAQLAAEQASQASD